MEQTITRFVNKIMNIGSRHGQFIAWTVFTLIFIAFFVVGIIVNTECYSFLLGAEKCTATISEIRDGMYKDYNSSKADFDSYMVGLDTDLNTAFVNYTVYGVPFKNIMIGQVNSSDKVGDKIEIYYDTSDPTKVKSANGISRIMLFTFIMGLFSVIGIIGIFVMAIRIKNEKIFKKKFGYCIIETKKHRR